MKSPSYKLGRQVWLTISPGLETDDNTDLSPRRPADAGLAINIELGIELTGSVNSDTGLIVNVTTIDEKVRQFAAPVLNKRIREDFGLGKRVDLRETICLLKLVLETLADKFTGASLSKLTMAINPFRKVSIDYEDKKMIYLSEKFEFAATHRLWNDKFSSENNFKVFGKCANPSGHGHNYTVEVVVQIPADRNDLNLGWFDETVEENLIKLIDHKNLNIDVPHFAKVIPTVENIAALAWEKLVDKFGGSKLHCITIWETTKTYCSYYGKGE